MTRRPTQGLILGLLVALAGSMAAAQESDSEDSSATEDPSSTTDTGRGKIFVEISDWLAQPAGLEYRIATVLDPRDPFGAQVLSLDHSEEPNFNFRAGFEFPGEVGDIILSYFAQEERSDLENLTPGLFLYGEINTSGFLAGVFNDALSDGFSAESRTRLRDVRVDYYRTAFKSRKVSGKWFVGYRRVTHDRKLDTQYFALAPNLPPIIPPVSSPRPDLVPRPDSAQLTSDWEGRGLEAGLDVRVPMFRDKVWFESGLAVAALRGKAATSYASETHFFAIVNNNIVQQTVGPPFDEFSDPTVIASVSQIAAQVGVSSGSESADGSIIETYIAVRWRFWKTAEFVAGFRNISYDGVGMDVQTDRINLSTAFVGEFKPDGTRILRLHPDTLARTAYSVDYEGFYFGLAVRF